jgi:hypothetical protein
VNTSTVSPRTLDLVLGQTNLYPPLLSTRPAIVGFSTGLPVGEDIDFSLVVNGVPGVPANIELRAISSVGGTLWVHPGFIAGHTGTWPVQVMLQASRAGMVIDAATLWLHDTRQMRIHRVAAHLLPNPAHLSDDEALVVYTRATFYDRAGLELPRDEVQWSVALPDAPPGLEVNGTEIRVAPGTAAGDVRVRIDEHSGVTQALTLTLLPALDIGLALSRYDLYPPLRSTDFDMVGFTTALPPEASPQYSYLLNGQGGQHPGLLLQQLTGGWGLVFWREFMGFYHGPWPAEITVRATLDGQLAGQRTLYLHDTRNMVCARMEMALSPSDTLDIPTEGLTVVTAPPRFFDAKDIGLPLAEIDWDATLENEPITGIQRTKHVLLISPEAQPGQHRMTVLGPNDLSASAVLTLR